MVTAAIIVHLVHFQRGHAIVTAHSTQRGYFQYKTTRESGLRILKQLTKRGENEDHQAD